jgi:cell division protein ZapE
LQRQRFVPAIKLLERHTEVLHLDGAVDYRLQQLRKASIYVDSQAPDAHGTLEATFAAVAGEPGLPDSTLTIEHRRLRTVREADDVAWFTFHELCEGPRSHVDYMELASWFHTIIVSDVPRFDEHSENAARRFIALIDVLYDHSVNLIVSAAAPPAELYRGKKLKAEFQRTASRLVEMQSDTYLSRPHRP